MVRKLSSEIIGTFLLVFIGTGSVVVSKLIIIDNPQLIIGIGFGVAVLFPILLFGKISGAHLNPAVTIYFFLKKQISLQEFLFYILAQLQGAYLGSLFVQFIFKTNKIGLTLPSGSYQESFILELILTAVLVLIIQVSTNHSKTISFAPYFIALTVALEAYFFGPICGASMNPARSFGPAMVIMNFYALELYFLAPISGVVLVYLLSSLYRKKS